MNKVQVILYIFIIIINIFGISTLVEYYKKTIRKNKSRAWENKLIALALSCLAVCCLVLSGIYKPVLCTIGAKQIVDYLFYIIMFYYLQFQIDMKIVKKLTKSCVHIILANYGFSDKQINDILNNIKKENE